MKTCLITCFLAFINVLSSQTERHLIKQIDSINSSALSYYDNEQYVMSFKSFNKVKKISDSINDAYGKSFSNLYLGNIYQLMNEYGDAKRSYLSMLGPSNEIKDDFLLAKAYLCLAILEKNKGDKKTVISYLEKAHSFISKSSFNTTNNNNYTSAQKYKLIFDIEIELCQYHIKNSSLNEALISLVRFEDTLTKATIETSYFTSHYNYLFSLYLVKKKHYNNANIKLNKAIFLLEQDHVIKEYHTELLLNVYKELSIVYDSINDRDNAYLTLLKHNKLNEAYLNKEKHEHAAIDKSKFLIEDYKNELELANTEKLLQVASSKKIKNINFIMAMTLLLLGISLITIYRSYSSKIKLTKTLEIRNEELELANNEAVKSSKLKSKFISNVTHELRTPLYGVVGLTSLLLDNNSLKASDSKYLKSLKYSGDYLLGLVNEVLEFSKIESEEIELKTVSVELEPLIKNIIGSFEYKLKETTNKIHLNFDKRIPKYIKCDNVRLSQVLINLIGNSVKFTSNGNIFVNVILKNSNLIDDVDLRFEIQDDGVGIPKDKFKAIFENFTQLEQSNINYKGTGLGLSISKKIIELFGSRIELESECGFGSTFSFNVNFKIDNEGIGKEQIRKVKKKVRALKNYKILIAEDNKINQIVTKSLLEKGNYSCEIVENGEDAIDALKNNMYDLVLMDINMPKMDGIEATNIIRGFDLDIPVIALTAADIDDFNLSDKYKGFNGIITKPFDNYEFFQTIETNIELSKKGVLNQKRT